MSFTNTAFALRRYHETERDRLAVLDAVETDGDVWKFELMQLRAVRAVQRAFYEDTKDFNSLDHCMLASIEFMNMLVQKEMNDVNKSTSD